MRWTVHGERDLYRSPWVALTLVDVEIPDGERFEHHVVRTPRDAAGVVIEVPDRGVLLLYRHRFITDSWGWEIPAGGVDEGETPVEAAERESIEEVGWRPRDLRPLARFHPSNGLVDQTFHVFVANDAQDMGSPTEHGESEKIEWVTRAEVIRLIDAGAVTDGLSLTALLALLARTAEP